MNLNKEIRNGFTISSEIKGVWQVQLELVEELLRVCKKYNLKIWAEGGTLLGAIRHKGFIPWDDDIDFLMFREDYEKLVSIAPKEFTGNYFFQCPETEKGYIRGHAQLRRLGTAAISINSIWQNFNQGIFIDIFVSDYLPASRQERINIINKLDHQRNILSNKYYGSLFSFKFLNHLFSCIQIYFNGGREKFYKKMVKAVVDYPNKSSNEMGCVLWNPKYFKDFTFKAEWYIDTFYVPFEDILIPIPSGYNEILTAQYGDYMKPVQTPSLHGTLKFNTEISYTDILPALRSESTIKTKLQSFFSLRRLGH